MGTTREMDRARVRTAGRGVLAFQLLGLAAVAAIALATISDAIWNLGQLVVLAILTIVSALWSIEIGSHRVKVSGSALGLMLGVVLLGGSPAALLGAMTVGVMHIGSHQLDYYLLAFGTFVALELLNFVTIVGYRCFLDRTSVLIQARDVFLPLLSAELFSVALTVGTPQRGASADRQD